VSSVTSGSAAITSGYAGNSLPAIYFKNFATIGVVATWSFFTNHARVLICISRDPGLRLRDLADTLDITERSAHGIVSDLVDAGYVVKEKDGRRNRYGVQAQLPLPEPVTRERTIGEVLGILVDADARGRRKPPIKKSAGRTG
jgi:hypothetical protein